MGGEVGRRTGPRLKNSGDMAMSFRMKSARRRFGPPSVCKPTGQSLASDPLSCPTCPRTSNGESDIAISSIFFSLPAHLLARHRPNPLESFVTSVAGTHHGRKGRLNPFRPRQNLAQASSYPSNTTRPSLMVKSTLASLIFLGSQVRILVSRQTMSAFLPTSRVPTLSSKKFSYATLVVYACSTS